jgi:argininosuccinate synthase
MEEWKFKSREELIAYAKNNKIPIPVSVENLTPQIETFSI